MKRVLTVALFVFVLLALPKGLPRVDVPAAAAAVPPPLALLRGSVAPATTLGGLLANALTPAERRIAELAAHGATNREIARRLYLSPKTVEMHLRSCYLKLNVTGRAQLERALA